MLLDYATAEPDASVRECPLCPSWVECAHYGDECVRFWDGPAEAGVCWGSMEEHVSHTDSNFRYFDTEAEARAEFERRVALMLGRDDDAMD